MDDMQWIQLIAAVIVLVLLFPTIIYVFRQQNALRNVVIWIALLVALVFGFMQFGHLLPDNVKRNFGISSQAPVAQEAAPAAAVPDENDGPVRNP